MPDDDPILIEDYHPEWPKLFRLERDLIASAIGPWLAGPIEHIGSTAVPGLVAKPVIDIMAPVESLDRSRPALEAIAALTERKGPFIVEALRRTRHG